MAEKFSSIEKIDVSTENDQGKRREAPANTIILIADEFSRLEHAGVELPEGRSVADFYTLGSYEILHYTEKILSDDNFWSQIPNVIQSKHGDITKNEIKSSIAKFVQICREESEEVYVVTNLKDGSQEVMDESKMREHFSDSKDAKSKEFKVKHYLDLSMDDGKIWGRPGSNYSNFKAKGEPVYDDVSGKYWCEMEFIPDEK